MKKYLYVCLVFLGFFLLWTCLYKLGYLEEMDLFVRSIFENGVPMSLYSIASCISFFSSIYFLVPLTIVFLFIFQNHREKLYLLITLIGSTFLSQAFKLLLKRKRATPFFGTLPKDYSYPSGHTIAGICFYSFLYVILDKKVKKTSFRIIGKVLCISLMILIPFSRIFLGVHYLSDVIASIFLSFSFLFGLLYVSKEDIFKR